LLVCVVEAEVNLGLADVNVARVGVSSATGTGSSATDDVTSGWCGEMGRQSRVSGCGSSAS